MASNWLYIDTNFPAFTGQESTEEKVTTIQNYMFMLVEQLRYTLHNLDLSNANTAAVEQFTGSITGPIYGRIEDDEGNITALQVTAEGLQAQVSDANGNISILQQTATSLQSQITDANGNISTLQQTATGLQSQISTANGNISTLQQTATSLQSQISTANGNISTLQQTATSLSASVTNLNTGMGSKLMLDANGLLLTGNGGYVSMNGGSITANTVKVNSLYGNTIYLYDYNGLTGCQITITSGQTTPYGVLDFLTHGYRVTTTSGDIYFQRGVYPYSASQTTLQLTSSIVQTNCNLCTTNSYASLGDSSHIWAAVYASTGEIVTSDESHKTDVEVLPGKYGAMLDELDAVRYKLTDGQSGRYHVGFVAQQVKAAMDEAGVDPTEFGGWCLDTDKDGNPIQMLRYEEFLPILWAELKAVKAQIAQMKTGT